MSIAMHARTLFNITRTRKLVNVFMTLAGFAVPMCMSCTSSTTLEDIPEIEPTSVDALTFTCQMQENEKEHVTRASQGLTTGFAVSTFKAHGFTTQQTVMNGYKVEYKTSGTAWDGNVRPFWDYTTVTGQSEKYWDYASFPYRFHAVAPYPSDPEKVSLGDKTLTINAPYYMQSVTDGAISPVDAVAEPYLVAQVQRDGEGHDYDMFVGGSDNEINKNGSTLNRSVELPFHHINSKVRFAVYCTSPWATSNPLYIEGLKVDAYSPGFVTEAEGYTAPPSGSSASANTSWYIGTGTSGFTDLTKVPATPATHTTLLTFTGGKDVPDNDNDLSKHQSRSSAYWLQCPGGIKQIPQEGVKLCVSFELYKKADDGSPYKTFTNIPVKLELENGVIQDKFNWISGCIHTYYLIISGIEDKLEITFTATLTPWVDVTGSLSTDLEQ